MLNEFIEVFGKPAALKVEIDGKVVLKSGEFQKVRKGVYDRD